jgi:hypothetical protein
MRAAVRRDAAVGVERVELAQQLARLGERGGGGGSSQRSSRGIGDAPGGELERERREVRLEDLGGPVREQCGVLGSVHRR